MDQIQLSNSDYDFSSFNTAKKSNIIDLWLNEHNKTTPPFKYQVTCSISDAIETDTQVTFMIYTNRNIRLLDDRGTIYDIISKYLFDKNGKAMYFDIVDIMVPIDYNKLSDMTSFIIDLELKQLIDIYSCDTVN